MKQSEELLYKIEALSEYLDKVIELKRDLKDTDVVAVSKMLDCVLNDYYLAELVDSRALF